MNKPRILYFDIETSPALSWVWSTGKQYVGHTQILEDSKIICISWKWQGKPTIYNAKWTMGQSDKTLLERFSKIANTADQLIGHNGRDFDMKHINARILYHDLPPIAPVSIQDTLKASRAKFRLASHSLDYLAKYLKVGSKMAHKGIELWLGVWLRNNRKELEVMVKYCDHDVRILEKVHLKLAPHIPNPIAANLTEGDVCDQCSSSNLWARGYHLTKVAKKRRYQCQDCGKWLLGGKNLLTKPGNRLR